MLLPVVTTATGAFLLVLVLALGDLLREQTARFGNAADMERATLAIGIVVLLVGVVEVAIASGRAISQRSREIGVLTATGVSPSSVLVTMLVEPCMSALIGAAIGAALAAATTLGVLPPAGFIDARPAIATTLGAAALAVIVSGLAAAAAWALPTPPALRGPLLAALTHMG